MPIALAGPLEAPSPGIRSWHVFLRVTVIVNGACLLPNESVALAGVPQRETVRYETADETAVRA